MPLLFSYGTLQEPRVQRALFGRLLRGEPDELVGFERTLIEIEDADAVATSGKALHYIVRADGRGDGRVRGTVLELTDDELAAADRYESVEYTRIRTTLASGKEAWVYVDAHAPGR